MGGSRSTHGEPHLRRRRGGAATPPDSYDVVIRRAPEQSSVEWSAYERGDVDLVILTGGETPVDDTGWMATHGLENTGRLMKLAEEGKLSLLGICLESQMMAHHLLPGSVRPASFFEVGMVNVGVRLPVAEFHYHAIGGGAILYLRSACSGFIPGNARAGLLPRERNAGSAVPPGVLLPGHGGRDSP